MFTFFAIVYLWQVAGGNPVLLCVWAPLYMIGWFINICVKVKVLSL